MTSTNILFVAIGAAALLAGLAILVTAIRERSAGESPKVNAMLIGGMMLTAFGLILGGFAIAYATTEPLDLNSAEPAQ